MQPEEMVCRLVIISLSLLSIEKLYRKIYLSFTIEVTLFIDT